MNEKERANLCVEEFQIIYIDAAPSRREIIYPQSSGVWLHMVVWREEKERLYSGRSDTYCLSEMIRVNVTVTNCVASMYPLYYDEDSTLPL